MIEDTNVAVQDVKQVWAQPDVKELAVEDTAGNGGAGFDFASEAS